MKHGQPLIPHKLTVIKNEFPDNFGMPGRRVFARYDHGTDSYWVDKYIFETICKNLPTGPKKVEDMVEDINKIGSIFIIGDATYEEAHCYSLTDLLHEKKLDPVIRAGLAEMGKALQAAKGE